MKTTNYDAANKEAFDFHRFDYFEYFRISRTHLCANLVTALAGLNVDDFPHVAR